MTEEANAPGALPLVYACSGCSSAAQLANQLALRLDRMGLAEMSCIAGVGGDVPHLVRIARSGRPIAAIDGCPLECVASCLKRHGIVPGTHHVLSQHGVRKRYHADPDPRDVQRLLGEIAPSIDALRRRSAPGALLGCGPGVAERTHSARALVRGGQRKAS